MSHHLPLRLKLTFWLLIMFALVYGATLLAAWALYREVETRSIDERLSETARGLVTVVQRDNGDFTVSDLQRAQPIDRQYSILALRDGDGQVLVSRDVIDRRMLPPLPDEGQAAVSRIRRLDSETAGRLVGNFIETRMITHGFFIPGGELRFIDIARTTSIHSESTTFVQDCLIIGVIGALLISLIASWFIAGRAVGPMHRIADAARVVDPEHIDSRFTVTSTDSEVDRLQQELNDALGRIEKGYRAQEQFICHVAHDLKNLIAVMLAESQILKTEESTPEQLEGYRRSIIEEMQRMGGLVESFLTMARADQGETMARRTMLPVNDVVVESIARCGPEASQNEVRLIPMLLDTGDEDEPPWLYGDPDLLCTMLDNLVRNAIRHSRPGERVEIRAVGENGEVRLSVRDHGPGIAPEIIDRIFDRFVRFPNGNSSTDGLGLGLAIARSVAQSHGGAIRAANCPDGGCIFTVTLPTPGSHDSPPQE